MKAIEQYFHVVLFIMLYKVVLTLKSVDEALLCDHSNESYWAVLLCDTVGWNPSVTIQIKSYLAVLSCGTVHYDLQGSSSIEVSG